MASAQEHPQVSLQPLRPAASTMAGARGHPLMSYQPLRLLFQLAYAASVLACLPYYIAVASIPAWRPNPRWGFGQTLMTRVAYRILDATSRVGVTETLTLDAGKEGDRFKVVEPAPPEACRGPLASSAVQRATVGGTWFPHAPDAAIAAKTVVLYFHGGAFIAGDGRDASCGPIADKLLKKGCAEAVFSLQYRLSGYGGQNPFPAALQDALASYLYLVKHLAIPASQVVVAGDSSGGNLATALLLYLSDYGSAIGLVQPKCAVLISPWVAPFHYDMQASPNRGTDFIPETYPAWGSGCYAGHLLPLAKRDPYITPLGNKFSTPVPIFAHAGTAELFLSRIVQWADDMRSVEGNSVELYLEEDAPHDSILSAELLGFVDSAWMVAAKAAEFVRKH